MARETKRTKEVERIILEAMRKGLSLDTAASLAAVGRRTVYDWREKDPGFRTALDKARADGVDEIANKVTEAAREGKQWAVMFWLSRRAPEFREPREQPIDVDTSEVKTVGDAQKLIVQILQKAVADGVSPAAIADLAKAISSLAESDKLTGLQQQIEELRELVARKTA